jgi:hypothetical protein
MERFSHKKAQEAQKIYVHICAFCAFFWLERLPRLWQNLKADIVGLHSWTGTTC